MKCEMCHEGILKGRGYYYTPHGIFCTRCYGVSGGWIQMPDTRAQFQKNPGVSECGLCEFSVANFQLPVFNTGL